MSKTKEYFMELEERFNALYKMAEEGKFSLSEDNEFLLSLRDRKIVAHEQLNAEERTWVNRLEEDVKNGTE